MKILLKIIGTLIIAILVLAFVLPMVFKSKLKEVAKEEINKNVDAKVDFADFGLTLFKNFPNFTMSLEGLSVVGKGGFEKDTLANIKSIGVVIDLFSVVSGSTYEIQNIQIIEPVIHVKTLKDGKSNYDIAIDDGNEQVEQQGNNGESADVNLKLKNFEIINGSVVYEDASMDFKMEIIGLNHTLKGDLSADKTTLKTKTTMGSLNVVYDGVNYLNKVSVDYKAGIGADLKNGIYTLMKNDLLMNKLNLKFDGSVSFIKDDINLVLTFNAPKTKFKDILSLVPAVYSKDFENVETSGEFSLDGHVKGIYNENTLPAFNLQFLVDNAMFKYPDLPKAVTGVYINTKVSNPGGDADNTIVDISRFKMKLGQNPIDMRMLVKTPVSDPDISAKIKGKMELASVKDFYPLEDGESLKGSILADITLDGKMSAIDEERYADFTALGSLLIKGMEYESPVMDEVVEIGIAQLNFSPEYLDLVSFKTKIGNSDFGAKGKILNYLDYTFNDGLLKGELETNSSYLDISALMPAEESPETTSATTTDTTALSVVEIPGNIEFVMKSSFNKLIYDGMEMENVNGHIDIKDQTVFLRNFSMNILEGEMSMTGMYSTKASDAPKVDFDLNMKNLDIQKSYQAFDIMETYLPVAAKTTGTFSTKMKFQSTLDKEMMPDYATMTGGGELSTSKILVNGLNTLEKLADLLKVKELKNIDINKILVQFEFVGGKIITKPFDLKTGDIKANLGGWTALDQSIGYKMDMEIPRSSLGANANNTVNDILGKANIKGDDFKAIPLTIDITGTLTDPKLKAGFNDMGKTITEEVKEIVKEEIKKKKEEISKEAREQAAKIIADADKKAQQLIKEAEKQAANIRKEAKNGAKQIRDEAEKQAKNLEAEGKKNGYLAEIAAKKAAKKVRSEGDKQANNLTSEADKQATSVVSNAKKQAAQIKKNAQQEADRILKPA
ncbi:MAG: hypothetical protein DRJ05_07030 [Bacteroidetes bacterium]|nr:MAG: hypothetical protein DRJ05_07030 [Bacteroidota bacterium]